MTLHTPYNKHTINNMRVPYKSDNFIRSVWHHIPTWVNVTSQPWKLTPDGILMKCGEEKQGRPTPLSWIVCNKRHGTVKNLPQNSQVSPNTMPHNLKFLLTPQNTHRKDCIINHYAGQVITILVLMPEKHFSLI